MSHQQREQAAAVLDSRLAVGPAPVLRIKPDAVDTKASPLPLPSELLPVQALPFEALPDAIRPWVLDVGERMQCPPDFVAVPLLVAVASMVGRKLTFKPQARTDWTERGNLWGLIVGRPGVMKSPAMAQALAPLARLEAQAGEQHGAALADFEAQQRAEELRAKVNIKQAEGLLKRNPGADVAHLLAASDLQRPARRRFLVNDLTYEALGAVLAENPDGVLLLRDELRGLLVALGKEDNATARAFYLQAWSGGRYTFDRIGRGTVTIPDARLSIVGAIQPGPLAQFIRTAQRGGAGDDGLLQRFLICWPDQPGEWRDADTAPDSSARRAVHALFDRIEGLQPQDMDAQQDTDFRGEPEGLPFVRFTDEARELFLQWRGELERKLRGNDTAPAVEAALSKFRKHVPALALALHVADEGAGAVGLQATARALDLAGYFESHLMRAYASGAQATVQAARAILHKLDAGKLDAAGFTARDVYRAAWSGLTDRDLVAEALDMLAAHRHLSELTVDTGGRPQVVYSRGRR
ncbi:YfjI family protein [Azohydromonas aeria]|uniref:YfjI family protein n=1 Tax=Azohydromonas aeria TaxID=2590212 RepID=UPI0018E0570C|nr:YfjI family protein [Azohydromonas aeria]